MQVNTNVPTQSLTLARTLTRTHTFPTDVHAVLQHMRTRRLRAEASADTNARTRLQSHRLISLRELSTASREMAQEAEHWKQNGVPNQGD